MASRKGSRPEVNLETLEIARGLYETKVCVKRPPSSALQHVYSSGAKGPPLAAGKRRPFSANARINTTDKVPMQISEPQSGKKPPWRPFSGRASLSRQKQNVDRWRDCNLSHRGVEEDICEVKSDTSLPDVYQNRQLPQSLVALQQWLSESIPSSWSSGYDPQTNFVFLPDLDSGNHANLPYVPPHQGADEVLAFTPVLPVKQYKPPKPRLKRFTEPENLIRCDTDLVWEMDALGNGLLLSEDVICSEKRSATVSFEEQIMSKDNYPCIFQKPKMEHMKSVHSDDDAAISKPDQIKVYDKDGEPIHKLYQGKRTSDIIRQEIVDLERLLQGIGNPHGSSLVVRYQHDINHLKDMAKFTLDHYGISQDMPPSLTPVAAVLQEDLLKYPDRHKEIMASIKQRRDECVCELAEVEQAIMSIT